MPNRTPYFTTSPVGDAFANTAGVDEIGLPGVAAPPPVALVEQRGLLRHETPELSFAVDLGALDDFRGDRM